MADEPVKLKSIRTPPDPCMMALLKATRALDTLKTFEERRRVLHWLTDKYSQREFPTMEDIERVVSQQRKDSNALRSTNGRFAGALSVDEIVAAGPYRGPPPEDRAYVATPIDLRQTTMPLETPAVDGETPPPEDPDSL